MGTILLAEEGINGNVSGSLEALKALQAFLEDLWQGDWNLKFSSWEGKPFRRMLVKLKKEIITMGREHGDQSPGGSYLEPQELMEWYQEGRPMVLLDTRNLYESQLGSFQGALKADIHHFGAFPQWLKAHPELKEKTLVTFCTGGIRCEKATAHMKEEGFQEVYQLKGGILNYLEKAQKMGGEEYWEGDCVVFDRRKALAKDLKPSPFSICYICLGALGDERAPASLEELPQALAHHHDKALCSPCAKAMTASHRKRQERASLRRKQAQARGAKGEPQGS